jgi:hypothetical protein
MTSYSGRRLPILPLLLVVIACLGCNKTAPPPPTTAATPTTAAATPAANVDFPNVQVTSAHLERNRQVAAPATYWVFATLNNSGPGPAQAKGRCSWTCINSEPSGPQESATDTVITFPANSTADLRTDLSSPICSSNARPAPVHCEFQITRTEKTEPSKMITWQGSLPFPQ